MIGTIEVRVTAGHLNQPLRPVTLKTGSAVSIGVLDVPKARFGITISGVKVSISNADATPMTVDAVANGNVWTATFPASHFQRYGGITNGLRVVCVGKDENETSREWCVGVGDIYIEASTPDIDPGSILIVSSVNDNVPDANGNVEVEFPVTSVNSMTGDITLTAADVGAPTTSDLNRVSATANGAATNARNATLAIASHTGNTNNPHGVTAAQVGLGNVDNTSDADKPVSTAQQTALNGKVSKQTGYGLAQIGTPSSYGALNIKVIGDDGTTSQVGIYNKAALDSMVSTINSSIASKASNSSLSAHTGNTSNPHNVTAAQIGAVSKTTIEALGDDYTMDDIAAKINAIIRALAPCILCLFGLFAFGDTVDTARLGSLKSSAIVVTNVHFTAYQPILTAGENITISNNVISAAGGGSASPTGFENQTNTISYPEVAGNAVNLTITDAGVLSVNGANWVDGQSVFVTIRPAGSYTVQGINLIGYGSFPTNAAQAVIWKVGTAYYLSVISAL